MRDTTADVCVIAGDTNLKSDIETRDVVSRYMSTNWGLVDNCINKKDDFILILGTAANTGGHSDVFRKQFWAVPHYAVWATVCSGHAMPDPQLGLDAYPTTATAYEMLQDVADHVLAPPYVGAPAVIFSDSDYSDSEYSDAMDAETPAPAPPPAAATWPPAATAPAAAPTQPSQPEQLAAPQGAARPGAERQRQRPAAVRQPAAVAQAPMRRAAAAAQTPLRKAAVAQTPLRKRVLGQLASCARRRCT